VKQPDFQPYQDPSRSPVESETDKHCPSALQVYTFTIHGSAFLWHQVRHMVSIIFLIGQGFEKPSLMKELLDVNANPRRPTYEMASDAPLVLWDCIFPDPESDSREDALEWIYAGDPRTYGTKPKKSDSKFGVRGTIEGMWSLWRQRKIDEILAGSLLDRMVSQGGESANGHKTSKQFKPPQSQVVFYGGNEARLGGQYVPVMEKRKMASVEVQNAKYLANKNAKKEKRAQIEEEEGQ
jgi:tRNA pseudouridine38/39 synthase